jgi:hypothetical protein
VTVKGMLQYWDFLETMCDPEKLFSKYFGSLDESLELYEIAMFYDGCDYRYIIEQSAILRNSSELKSPICRLVICSQNVEDITLGHFLSIFASKKYGFNHLAIQIGIVLIHWVNMDFPVIEAMFSSNNTCAMLYPNSELEKNVLNQASIRKVCDITAKWAHNYTYSFTNRNCQHFAIDMLNELEKTGIKNTWMKNGPINKFLEIVSRPSKNSQGQVIVYDVIKKQELIFKEHQDLREYYQHSLLPKRDEITKEEFEEMQHVAKCVERAWIFQGGNEVKIPIFQSGPGQITFGLK